MNELPHLLRGRVHCFGLTEADFVMPPVDDPRVRRTRAGLELDLTEALAEAERQGRRGVYLVAWPGSGVARWVDALERSHDSLRVDAGDAFGPDDPVAAALKARPKGNGGFLALVEGLHQLTPERAAEASQALGRWSQAAPDARFVVTGHPDAVPPDRLGTTVLEIRVTGLDGAGRRHLVHACAGQLHGSSLARERGDALLRRIESAARRAPESHRLATNPLALTALSILDALDVDLPETGSELSRVWSLHGPSGSPLLPTDAHEALVAFADARVGGDSAPSPSMVTLPAGTFAMGSEEDEEGRWDDEGPVHRVTVPRFQLGARPVTNAEYAAYLQACPEAPTPAWWDDPEFTRPDQPVVGVSWSEARSFAEWSGARLPTEAEWEYACRSGTSGPRYGALDDVAWYRENSEGTLRPVGTRAPTPWGVHDLLGNAWEWVEDDHHPGYEGAPTDARAWVDEPRSGHRILRGGSWADAPRVLRAATRLEDHPGPRIGNVGFRLARAPDARPGVGGSR